jgi:hypothetical protein
LAAVALDVGIKHFQRFIASDDEVFLNLHLHSRAGEQRTQPLAVALPSNIKMQTDGFAAADLGVHGFQLLIVLRTASDKRLMLIHH